ncbi:MAG: hypothetical protein VX975_00040 [Acidobacteriota bacterium]|nr:hypothetical protein [Acidobacteriota bacterium]
MESPRGSQRGGEGSTVGGDEGLREPRPQRVERAGDGFAVTVVLSLPLVSGRVSRRAEVALGRVFAVPCAARLAMPAAANRI